MFTWTPQLGDGIEEAVTQIAAAEAELVANDFELQNNSFGTIDQTFAALTGEDWDSNAYLPPAVAGYQNNGNGNDNAFGQQQLYFDVKNEALTSGQMSMLTDGYSGAEQSASDNDYEDADKSMTKEARNAAERRRRAKLKDAMFELKELVPSLTNEKKVSKAVIYNKTVEWLQHIDKINSRIKNENLGLKTEVERLRNVVQDLCDQIRTKDAPAITQQSITNADFDQLRQEASDFDNWTVAAQGYGMFGQYSQPVPGEAEHLVVVYQQKSPDGNASRIRASCIIPSSPSAAFAVLYDFDRRKDWDASLINYQAIENSKANGGGDIVYTAIKSPSVMADRDYVQARRCKDLGDGGYVICIKSVVHPDFPLRQGFIRGEIMLSGYVIEAIQGQPNRCLMTSIMQVDIKGKVSNSIVNLLSIRSPFPWYDSFISATDSCNQNLVDCWRRAFLRLVMI